MPMYVFGCETPNCRFADAKEEIERIISKPFGTKEDASKYCSENGPDCPECTKPLVWKPWAGKRGVRINFAPY